MSKLILIGVLVIISVYYSANGAPSSTQSIKDFNRVAPECNRTTCVLPSCRCSGTDIPGGLSRDQTPQFVMLTFDDAVTVSNFGYYNTALNNRTNKDGCPAAATFYISHEYTDYTLVHQLHAKGHEIALHSITHSSNTLYWRTANFSLLTDEFAGERTLMSHFAKIPAGDIQGIRMPFLQLAGETSFEMLKNNSLSFDASWPSQQYLEPGLWPYTLDTRSNQDCPIGPCPVESWPGVWVAPMLNWKDRSGVVCAMVDTCVDM